MRNKYGWWIRLDQYRKKSSYGSTEMHTATWNFFQQLTKLDVKIELLILQDLYLQLIINYCSNKVDRLGLLQLFYTGTAGHLHCCCNISFLYLQPIFETLWNFQIFLINLLLYAITIGLSHYLLVKSIENRSYNSFYRKCLVNKYCIFLPFWKINPNYSSFACRYNKKYILL